MDEEKLIKCDICSGEFSLKDAKHDATTYEGMIVKYFECPHCKYRYPYILEDLEHNRYITYIKTLQLEFANRRRKGKSIPPSRLRKLNKLFEDAKAHQMVLRDKYIKAVTTQLNKVE